MTVFQLPGNKRTIKKKKKVAGKENAYRQVYEFKSLLSRNFSDLEASKFFVHVERALQC